VKTLKQVSNTYLDGGKNRMTKGLSLKMPTELFASTHALMKRSAHRRRRAPQLKLNHFSGIITYFGTGDPVVLAPDKVMEKKSA